MEYKYFKYNDRLKKHFNKHVLGVGVSTKRESEHWQKYHIDMEGANSEDEEVKEEWLEKAQEEYLNVANDNLNNAKRVFNYITGDGNASYNYQKENISYYEDMPEDEYEGLLTTCLNKDNTSWFKDQKYITSCFYRTINYSNIELIAMVNAIYNAREIFVTGRSLCIDGFYDSSLPAVLVKSFIDVYNQHEVGLHYDYDNQIKVVLNKFLQANLKEIDEKDCLNHNIYVVFSNLVDDFLNRDSFNPTDIYAEFDIKDKGTYSNKFILEQLDSQKEEDNIIEIISKFAREIMGDRTPSRLFNLFVK